MYVAMYLTENLRDTIKQLRKDYNIRGDDLSKEMGKGAAYISQIESGKINKITLCSLYSIISAVAKLGKSDYDLIITNLIKNNYRHITENQSEKERWVFLMDYYLHTFQISHRLYEYIDEHFQNLNTDRSILLKDKRIARITVDAIFNAPQCKYPLPPKIITIGGANEFIRRAESGEFNDYFNDIIEHKITSTSYMEMEIALYYLHYCEGYPLKDIWDMTHKKLLENGIVTVAEQYGFIFNTTNSNTTNTIPVICDDTTVVIGTETDVSKPLKNDMKNFEGLIDDESVNLPIISHQLTDSQYEKYILSKNCISSIFDFTYNKNSPSTMQKIEIIKNNLISDPFFALALMGQDLTPIINQPTNTKKEFLSEVKKLIEKYSSTNTTTFDTYDD